MIGFRFPAFGWGASFWAFLVTRISQHWAFLTEGCQGFFNSSVFVQPCRGKNFFLVILCHNGVYTSVLGIKGTWDFLVLWIFLFNIVILPVGVLLSLFFGTFVSGVCLSIYYTCLMLSLLLVCWVRENFSGGPGHIFPVWDSAVWSGGPVQFIWVLGWSGWRDCTGFLFLALL